jgi:hypothetical protein
MESMLVLGAVALSDIQALGFRLFRRSAFYCDGRRLSAGVG